MTDEYRHRTTLQVRFRDLDAFGHVNNAVFFSYAELARIRYLVDVLRPEVPFDRMPLILARVELDYRSPILFGEEVTVETRVDRIGGSSFSMTHRMAAEPGSGGEARHAADVASVLVAYDYVAGRPIRVPDEWRERMGAHEGRDLSATDAPRPSPAAVAG